MLHPPFLWPPLPPYPYAQRAPALHWPSATAPPPPTLLAPLHSGSNSCAGQPTPPSHRFPPSPLGPSLPPAPVPQPSSDSTTPPLWQARIPEAHRCRPACQYRWALPPPLRLESLPAYLADLPQCGDASVPPLKYDPACHPTARRGRGCRALPRCRRVHRSAAGWVLPT